MMLVDVEVVRSVSVAVEVVMTVVLPADLEGSRYDESTELYEPVSRVKVEELA